jgi:hypothetical protein
MDGSPLQHHTHSYQCGQEQQKTSLDREVFQPAHHGSAKDVGDDQQRNDDARQI